MVHLLGVAKSFGKQQLFAHVDLILNPGDRVGLVGGNGTGKTTLFRIIVGDMLPDEGEVRRPKDLRIGYLRQEVAAQQEGRLLETVIRQVRGLGALMDERAALLAQLEAAAAEDSALSETLAHRLAEREDLFVHRGGYEIEAEARSVLSGLGFAQDDMQRPLVEFSGGWQMRAELARLLLDRPDLLLLDEPTNHLDIPSMQWFEAYLAQFAGTMLIVAHDREFLNRTVNRIVEARTDGLHAYPGNYDRYVALRDQDTALQEKHFAEQQARIREIQDFIDRNRARKDRARQVQSRIKMLEGIERLERPAPRGRTIHFRFPQPVRTGRDVISLQGAAKRYGDLTVFENLDLTVYRGDKVALVGVNGAGKSTLMKCLAGVIVAEAGRRTLGVNVTLDYYAQHQVEALHGDWTVLQEMDAVADFEAAPHIRGLLGAFLFTENDVEKRVAVLSGGEKSRLALARMLLRPVSLLLLDEPTNHLDIASREVLEQALRQYEGTLIFTSHDRRFIDAVATKVIHVEHGCLSTYPGNYSDYEWQRQRQTQIALPAQPTATTAESDKTPPRARDQEKLRRRQEAERRQALSRILKPLRDQITQAETEIEAVEHELAELDLRLQDPATYQNREEAARITKRHEQQRRRRSTLYERLEQLEQQRTQAEAEAGTEVE